LSTHNGEIHHSPFGCQPSPTRIGTRELLGSPGARIDRALDYSFFEDGIMIRQAGDAVELMLRLTINEREIGEIMDKTEASIKAAA
jgi:adenosylmethionine-8-amino-7-oxononanoate aminotransferase